MGTKVEGVLLDVDGTLIDSNEAHARSWSEALAEFGKNVPAERILPLIGMGGDKIMPDLLGADSESPTGKRFSKRRAGIFRERYVPKLQRTRGAKELIRRLRDEKLRLVIATSAREQELEAMLDQVGLDDLIERRTSSDDAENSKPDPDIIQAALKKGKLDPSRAIMIGDTPYDVEAAARAGVRTVALMSGGWDAEGLAGAIAVYRDPADLLENFTASVFGAGA